MRFTFLVYMSRSGSTVFARQLALASSEIGVMPEFRLPELLITTRNPSANSSELSANDLRRLIAMDAQFAALGIGPDRLDRLLLELDGANAAAVLTRLAQEYLHGRSVKTVVLKLGSLLHVANAAMDMAPDSTFIHVFRDPRAVANSMLHTRRPYFPAELMGRGDPRYVAQQWTRTTRRARELERRLPSRVVQVRYEDFCHNATRVVDDVLAHLGVKRGTGSDIAIAEIERPIHRLVSREPTAERVDEWRTTLQPWQVVAVEQVAEQVMRDWGYTPLLLHQYPWMQVTQMTLRAHFNSIWCSLIHYGRRVKYYAARPVPLLARIRIAWRRRID